MNAIMSQDSFEDMKNGGKSNTELQAWTEFCHQFFVGWEVQTMAYLTLRKKARKSV